ncbi:HAMP domain-containing histidine kinase [Taibaiella lutea]|uniref:histidine kinase n=1 Tax=Taibaiella lutea TaxID=2608001 RepID=A0A5M6CNH7_9BACT|nr:HAMP domain-containing sensor histidine kinase [Taibaiella lutea]KAA5534699.1 HAMP domain-containing histidine kinase [Taibaiella lutea]
MRRHLYGLCFFLGLLFSCNLQEDHSKNVTSLNDENLKKIDSLLQYEKNDAARAISFEMLGSTSENDYYKKSYLYGYIGKSYKYSFHFDSAVYYTKAAYDLSLKINNKELRVEQAVWLLKVYSQSEAYATERQKLFDIVSNINRKTLDISTQALILDGLAEFYFKNRRYQMSVYVSSQELNLLKAHLLNRTVSHKDSLHMALCYLRLSDPYLWQSSIYLNTTRYVEHGNIEKGLRYLLLAREWMGSNSYLLAKYYHGVIYIHSIKAKNNIHNAVTFRDSLINLAKKTGHNFNDLIIQSNILISDVHFFLSKNNYKTDSSWKYFNDAIKYDSSLINPVISGYLQWLKGDLLLRDQKYDSALFTFMNIAGTAKMFTLNQLINYTISIADCHEKLDNQDSVIFYYKKYMLYTDSLLVVNEKKIITDIESEYQRKITQDNVYIKSLIIQNVRKQRLWLFTVAAALLCLSVLLIIFYKNKRKTALELDKQNAVLQHLNEQLKEANQTKAKLFAIISHDFRSPISQIYQFLKLQQSQNTLIGTDEKAKLEKQIQTAASGLLDNMEDLLIWSKTQMLLLNVVKEPVNIYSLCNQSISLLENIIRDKQLTIDIRMAPDAILETDVNFLMTIMRNILHNAIKASPEKGSIVVQYEQSACTKPCLKIINQGALFTQQNYLEALQRAHTSELLTNGLGLLIIDELSRKIGVNITFETINGDETCCTLQFLA